MDIWKEIEKLDARIEMLDCMRSECNEAKKQFKKEKSEKNIGLTLKIEIKTDSGTEDVQYAKIKKIKNGVFVAEHICLFNNKDYEIYSNCHFRLSITETWEKITEEEYNEAKKELIRRIEDERD